MDDTQQAPPPPGATNGPDPAAPGDAPADEGRWNADGLTDYRLLRRSAHDKKLGGVAGGLGRHLDVDPTIIRVLFVVAVFFGGAGLLVYTALWLVVPDDVTGRSVVNVRDSTRNVVVLVVLVLAALAAVGDTLDNGSLSWPPLVLVALVGFIWLMARDRRGDRASASASTPTWTPAPAGQVPPGAPPAPGAPLPPGAPVPPGPPAAFVPWSPPPKPPRRRRSGPLLFGVTLALMALAVGVLGLAEASGASVADAAYPALALTVVGVMLVVGSFYGRPGGLVLLGVLTSLTLAAVSVSEPRFDGERDVVVRPVQAADLDAAYDVPAGRIEVDLSDVRDLRQLDGRTLDLEANAGEILLVVPDGLAVDLDAAVAYGGAVDWPGGTRGGWDFGLDRVIGERTDPRLVVDADVDFGHIEVRQS